MSLKNLNLDRARILEVAANALPGAAVEPLVKKGQAHECSIRLDDRQALLHFFYNANGTTSINYKVGKHQDISEMVARYIADVGVTNPEKSFSLSLRGRSQDDVDLLIEYLKTEVGASLLDTVSVPVPYHTAYRLKSVQNDVITIKYFVNGTLQLQGKPLLLYRESLAFLSQFLSLEDVIRNQTINYKVDVDPKQVTDELQDFLPTAYSFLDGTILKILGAALTLRKIDVPMADYSSFVFPALRSLEGYLKQLFQNRGISLQKVNSFGDIFTRNTTGTSYILKPEVRVKVNCAETSSAIQRCYSLFSTHRHGLFHVDAVISGTRLIEKREDALNLIDTILREIESSYIPISEKGCGP
ncbi:MAG: type II toxin-antitoxin system RnlA family toxin [Nannocystis sp.]|nr:type II toxin-antitoxin system RnlA family toxin [Nannocystis sp.]